MTNYSTARQNMVDGQLRPNKVRDADVLARFAAVSRELFLPAEHRASAYADQIIQLSASRCLPSPLVTARLIQELHITPADNVLIVAMGTGYSTALIAGLTEHVTAIEAEAKLLDLARNALLDSDISHVNVIKSNPNDGYAANAPYDKILVEAPMGHVPPALMDQLKSNGKLAGIMTGNDGLMEATVCNKIGKTMLTTPLFETKGTILPSFAVEETFVF